MLAHRSALPIELTKTTWLKYENENHLHDQFNAYRHHTPPSATPPLPAFILFIWES